MPDAIFTVTAAPNLRQPPLEVRTSGIQGRGVFATRRIRKGRRIIEYEGERIDSDEADRRYPEDRAMSHHHTFLFGVSRDISIDAGVGGNAARFINHSCEPNCEAHQEGGRIFIDAIQNIQPGVELTYDYSLERDGTLPRNWRQLYACRCGATSCRGTMLAPRGKGRPKTSRRSA
jgi:hypothetical protein